MSDYVDYIEKQKAEIAQLEAAWEATVGELWKVGVQCLGEQAMESMLFMDKDAEKLQLLTTKAEPTLFVAEQGTSPPPHAAANKKRVTFDTPDDCNEPPLLNKRALHFLYQPSRLRVAPVPDMPALPKEEIGALETQIKEFGEKQLEDLKQAEKDYKLYWKKKNKLMAKVFED